jgi:hypothetical protein
VGLSKAGKVNQVVVLALFPFEEAAFQVHPADKASAFGPYLNKVDRGFEENIHSLSQN